MTNPSPGNDSFAPPAKFAIGDIRARLAGFARRIPSPWVVAGTLGLCAIVLFLRKPDQLLNPQFWAEDGVFYPQHLFRGWHTLIEPSAGYLHTVPRLIAGTSWWLDPANAPAWFVGCAAAATLYVASRALSPRQPLRPRPVLALAVVMVPDAFEVLLNGTNLQWILCAGLLLLLLSDDPRTAPGWVHDIVAAILLGLTGPFSVLLAPLFIARAWHRKTFFSWLLAGVAAAVGAVQFSFILRHHEIVPPDASVAWLHGASATGMRLAGSLFFGATLGAKVPMICRVLLAAVTIVIVATFALRHGGERRARAILAAAFCLLLAVSLYRCRWALVPLNDAGYGARYFFPLQLVMLWLIASALADSRALWRWSAAILLVVVVVVNFHRLREPALIDQHWRDYAPSIRRGEKVSIPINPSGWVIELPARAREP